MIELHELRDVNGEFKKYQGFTIKPEIGCLVRIIREFTNNRVNMPYRENTFDHLSIHKVYKVNKVINVTQVRIVDDSGCYVHLTKSEFQVVKHISDEEIKLWEQQYHMLKKLNDWLPGKVNNNNCS